MVTTSGLWALTCLFNPAGYARRMRNYRAFRAHLGVPLVAVELSFDGRFELQAEDADVLVRVSGGDVMWQKERLLNLGRRHLPAACDAVAVVDADLVFENRAWPTHARDLLTRVPVAQLFSRSCYMPPQWLPGDGPISALSQQVAVSRAVAGGVDPHAALGPQDGDGRGALSAGFAWVFRRALLDRLGLFDACIAGGGDTALACALWGEYGAVEERHAMTPAQRAHYRVWAEPWFDAVRGNVGYLEGDVWHLWHGELEDRMSSARHRIVASHEFDPRTDITAPPDAGWRWATDKPRLHEFLRSYFAARREDG